MSAARTTLAELRRLLEAPKPRSWNDLQPQVELALSAMEKATESVMLGIEAMPNQPPKQAARHAALIVRSLELATVAWEKVADAVQEME
jgi:hypothetical protein